MISNYNIQELEKRKYILQQEYIKLSRKKMRLIDKVEQLEKLVIKINKIEIKIYKHINYYHLK